MVSRNRWIATLTLAPIATAFVISCRAPGVATADGPHEGRGEFLYGRYCAVCHGVGGRGDGLPRGTLLPPPRDFSSGLFSLVSTVNGVPTDQDLVKVLRRGVPGSAMPSFGWLSDADLRSLVRYVRRLGVTEMASQLIEEAESEISDEQARKLASTWFEPGKSVPRPRGDAATPMLIEKGRGIYLRRCAACHSEQGTGQRPIVRWAGRKTIHWARDFTAGIMRGGVGHVELGNRIQAGMPGSAMPPNSFTDPNELEALVVYLKTLIPDGAEDRLVQKSTTIRVGRVSDPMRLVLGDVRWEGAPVTNLVLSPLRWRDDAIVAAEIRALHDGKSIYFLVTWKDKTLDEPAMGESGTADRVALQFTDDPEPTFFGMGSRRHPVHIWYWHPQPARLSAGILDIMRSPHRTMSDAAPTVRIPVRASSLVARGHGSAAEFPSQDLAIDVTSAWSAGRWQVLFRRNLAPDSAKDLSFVTRKRLRIALAIWDGATAKTRSDKSFTIWHDLRLE